jgi:hypothetical protein
MLVQSAYITTGDVTLPNTAGAWQPLAGFEISVAAAAGDAVEIATSFLNQVSSTGFLDVGVMVGTTVTRALSSGVATPAIQGEPSWYQDPTFGFMGRALTKGFVVTSGDLDTGMVRFVLITKAAGAGKVYASPGASGYPFWWQAKNLTSSTSQGAAPMAVKVTIATGKFNVALPDGNIYQAGDVAVLTDDEYAQISAAVKSTLLSTTSPPVITTSPADVDSEVNSPTAVVDAAGHTAIGDASAQAESQKPGKDTTYS